MTEQNEFYKWQKYGKQSKSVVDQMNRIHKALTYEGIEEPEYTSVIEIYEGPRGALDMLMWLYYDDNGILRKMVIPSPKIDWFAPPRIPEDHCLLNVELFDAQGEPIRYCQCVETEERGSVLDYLKGVNEFAYIRRYTYRNGVTKSEYFHISDDNLFSGKMPPEPVQEQLTEGLGWYCTEKYRTMDWWCDRWNDNRYNTNYTAIKCAEQYRDDIWVEMLDANRNWWIRIDSVLYLVGKPEISYGSELPVDDIHKIVIESNYAGIWEAAFQDYKDLKKVVLPDSLKWIESMAFCGCSSLTDITIPEGVTEIGVCAFEGCSSLTSITIPGGVTEIGVCTFEGCSSMSGITIPDSVTKIDSWAFKGCSSLTGIRIPDTVTEIGEGAFEGVAHIIYHGPARSGDNWGALSRN